MCACPLMDLLACLCLCRCMDGVGGWAIGGLRERQCGISIEIA